VIPAAFILMTYESLEMGIVLPRLDVSYRDRQERDATGRANLMSRSRPLVGKYFRLHRSIASPSVL